MVSGFRIMWFNLVLVLGCFAICFVVLLFCCLRWFCLCVFICLLMMGFGLCAFDVGFWCDTVMFGVVCWL